MLYLLLAPEVAAAFVSTRNYPTTAILAILPMFVQKMMAPDPAQRPTAEQLLKSALLNLTSGGGHLTPQHSPLPMSQ